MESDFARNGKAEPKEYPHFKRIQVMFDKAKKKAWAQLRTRPDVKVLIEEQRKQKADAAKTRNEINNQSSLIRLTNGMY
jgi:hypothetical protein